MVARLDADQYNEADLLTIKVPLKLPYQTTATDFERIDGEIKVDGKIYKYVKRKIENGHLVLLCLPDEAKMQLEDARHTAFKITNDTPAGKNDATKNIVLKNILSDYDRTTPPWTLQPFTNKVQYQRPTDENLFYSFSPTAEQPPEIVAA